MPETLELPRPTAPRRHLRPLLGTFVEIGAWPHQADTARAIDAAFATIARVHALLSFQDPASELSKLNAAPRHAVPLHPLTLRVLRLARAMMLASDHLFNCTVGGSLVQRGELPEHGGPPPLDRGNADDIILLHNSACLRRPVRLTLDGIAKGYAVDLATRTLQKLGVTCGWINAGGDLRAFGPVAIPIHRRELSGTLSSLGQLRNGAVASSRVSPQRDPELPAVIISGTEQGTTATGVWTVMARHAWRADALTKVAALTPAPVRAERINKLGGRLLTPE